MPLLIPKMNGYFLFCFHSENICIWEKPCGNNRLWVRNSVGGALDPLSSPSIHLPPSQACDRAGCLHAAGVLGRLEGLQADVHGNAFWTAHQTYSFLKESSLTCSLPASIFPVALADTVRKANPHRNGICWCISRSENATQKPQNSCPPLFYLHAYV